MLFKVHDLLGCSSNTPAYFALLFLFLQRVKHAFLALKIGGLIFTRFLRVLAYPPMSSSCSQNSHLAISSSLLDQL